MLTNRPSQVILAWGLLMTLGSSDLPAAEWPEVQEKMQARIHRDEDGASLPYRLLVPDGHDASSSTHHYPLVVFLHGAGERGDDNRAQLLHDGFLRLANPDTPNASPPIIVAPQCPKGEKWVEVPWKFDRPHVTPPEPSEPMRLLLDVLDQLEEEFPIDPKRRYAAGLSMGGFGVFDLCVRRPKHFAAVVAVCGGADDSKAETIASTAFWVFHGDSDGAVPVARSRSAVEALEQAGGHVRYTEYPRAGHNVWTRAFQEPELVEWLFDQTRP